MAVIRIAFILMRFRICLLWNDLSYLISKCLIHLLLSIFNWLKCDVARSIIRSSGYYSARLIYDFEAEVFINKTFPFQILFSF